VQLLQRLFFQKQGGERSYRNQNNGFSLFRITRHFFKCYLRKVHFVEFYVLLTVHLDIIV